MTPECEQPCHPGNDCQFCAEYWERMKDQGFWEDGQWTDKAFREWGK